MSGLLCLCGNGMDNCTVPSDFIAEIYRKNALEKAISEEMELVELWDENLEFWYCQKCRRLTVIDRHSWKYLRSYSRKVLERPVQFAEVRDWQELFFWRDREFYDAIEEVAHQTVGEFVKQHPSRYEMRLSADEMIVHVFSRGERNYLFSYLLDPRPDFAKE